MGSRTFCSLALSPLAYKSLSLHVLAHPSDPWSIWRLPLAIISRNLCDFMKAATCSIKLLRHLFLYIPSLLCFHQKGLVIAPRFRSCLHLRLKLDKSWHSPKHIKAAKPKLSQWKNDQRMTHSSSPDEKDMEPGEMSAPVGDANAVRYCTI